MTVEILHYTPAYIMVDAARIATGSISDSFDADKRLIKKIIELEHDSVLEHLVYTVKIKDISRALLQEWSRHRHISQTVESTRYGLRKIINNLKIDDYSNEQYEQLVNKLFIIPEDIDIHDTTYKPVYMDLIKNILNFSGERNDIAKYFLPESFKTKLIATINARELDYIITLRSKPNVLPEFRLLTQQLQRTLLQLSCPLHNYIWDLLKERRLSNNGK